jgi:hypothetical protein
LGKKVGDSLVPKGWRLSPETKVFLRRKTESKPSPQSDAATSSVSPPSEIEGVCVECGGQVALVVGFESADELVCQSCGNVLGLVDSHEPIPTVLRSGRPLGHESERVYPAKACAHCQTIFRPKKAQHQYCGATCRKRAERLRLRLQTLIGFKVSRRWLQQHVQQSPTKIIESKGALTVIVEQA